MAEDRGSLAAALAELRELTQGIHPAILTERGLPGALAELCCCAAIPAHLELTLERRPPEQVETAAYYVVSEALTNAAKHSHASEVRVTATYSGGLLTVEVTDDGAGGAAIGTGPGLLGVADRVEAVAAVGSVSRARRALGPGCGRSSRAGSGRR